MNSEEVQASENELGLLIHAAREEAGLTVRQAAELAGIDYSFWSRIENGKRRKIAPDDLQRIADVVNIDPSVLLAFIGVKPPAMPEPKAYFRKAYGMNDAQATEAAEVIANLREHQRQVEQATKKRGKP